MFTRLTTSLTKGTQTVFLRQLYEREGQRLRLELHCDSYENQSWGRIELWSGGRWEPVWSINGHEMRTKKQIVYDRAWESESNYEQDVAYLLKQARLVLAGRETTQ